MKQPKPPRLVTIAVLTTLTIILWVFFGVYRILTSKPTVLVPKELLAPIDASLDTDALVNIENRVFFEENEIPETIGLVPEIEKPAGVEFPPTASLSGEINEIEGTQLTPTPTASESGSLDL